MNRQKYLNKMKKILYFFFIFLLLSTSTVLFGTGKNSSNDNVILRISWIPDVHTTWPPDMARLAVFHAFLNKYTNINVEISSTLKLEGDAAEGNEYLSIAGGLAPDVFYLYGRKIGAFIDQGFIQSLSPFLEREYKKTGKPFKGIGSPDNIWELTVSDNDIMCVPYMYYVMALTYRRKNFVMAGLDPGHGPRNWDEFYRYAQKLTWIPTKEPGTPQNVPYRFGFALPLGPGQGWHFHQFVWSAGGEMVQAYKRCSKCDELTPSHIPFTDYSKFHVEIDNQKDYEDKISKYPIHEVCSKCGNSLDDVDKIEWRMEINKKGGPEALAFYQKMKFSKWMRCDNRKDKRHKGKFNLEIDLTDEEVKDGKTIACPVCGRKIDLSDSKTKKRIYDGVIISQTPMSSNQRIEYAMWITLMSEVQPDNDSNLGVTYFPSIDGGDPVSFIAGHYLAMSSQIKGEKADAAWEYIKFMCSEEAMRIRVKTLVDNGWGEWIDPKYLKLFGYNGIYKAISEERIKFFEKLGKNSRVEPYCRGYKNVLTKELRLPIDLALDKNKREDPKKVLDECAEHINTYVIGKLPDKVVKQRERLGIFLLMVTIVILFFVGKKIVEVLKTGAQKSIEGFGVTEKTWNRHFRAWMFLVMAVGSVLLWSYIPLVRGLVMGFQDYKILGNSKFVGLKNFVSVFSNSDFYIFLWQTIIYVSLSIILGFLMPIFLAILLTEIPKGKVTFRVIYYLPSVTTGLVTMFLWKQLLYNPTDAGVLNQLLMATPNWVYFALPIVTGIFCIAASMPTFKGGNKIAGASIFLLGCFFATAAFFVSPVKEPLSWLSDQRLAMICVILPGIWAGTGAGCLIYLAALKGIPDTQYEAADVDGAGVIAKLWNVLIPNIKALIIISFVGAFIGAFHAAQNIFVMTAGGPANKTMTLGLDIWYNSFLFLQFGYATAEAWILGAMLIGFTLIQLQVLNKVEFKKAE